MNADALPQKRDNATVTRMVKREMNGYNYGARMPHAVKSANSKNYAYDLNGNMLVRGTQHLE